MVPEENAARALFEWSCLKGPCLAEMTKFPLPHFHVISPNTIKYTTK